MRETWVQSLGREDPLEKEMATHSSILAWRIPWTEEPGGLQSTGWQRVGRLSDFTHFTRPPYLLLCSTAKLCLFVTPWTAAHQAPLSVGFSRQEHWSGSPFPSPGDLPNPGIEPRSPALQADSLPTELQGKPLLEGVEATKSQRLCTVHLR